MKGHVLLCARSRRKRAATRVFLAMAAMVMVVTSCATYAERTVEVNRNFAVGRVDEAYVALQSNRTSLEPRNTLLYHLNLGTLSHHLGEYERSNREFEEAFRLSESSRLDLGALALSQITNPEVMPYRGEDYELVLLHYYKALNYLSLDDLQGALVEVRRINIRLAEINQRYTEHPNRYTVDAFAMYLSGMLYEAAGEFNDAFIAYRNAYDVYLDQYQPLFDLGPTEQLSYGLIRSAARSGLSEERTYYEERFGMTYVPDPPDTGQVVILWHTGLGPVKAESSINFLVVKGQGGGFLFVNRELGISIPIVSTSSSQTANLDQLKVVRVAFPRFVEREPRYTSATASVGSRDFQLEPVQDLNAIAFATLQDRMVRDLAATLLRIAAKQATEALARKQNANLGTLLSIANALTEKADTRNWQTIPYAIHMARLTLPEGVHDISIAPVAASRRTGVSYEETVTVVSGRTTFVFVHSLDNELTTNVRK